MDDATCRTIVFADLAGFTALTEVHGDVAAVDLVERFFALTRDALRPEDSLVKMIGDAVMLSCASTDAAVAAVCRLVAACLGEPLFPALRVGMHHGPVVERGGDVFGTTVNIAARVAGRARAGQVLCTGEVAEAARRRGVQATALGAFPLRNVTEPVDLYELSPGPPPPDHAVDPVCRMRVTPAEAVAHLRYADADHWFCSLGCAALFAATPDRFPPREG